MFDDDAGGEWYEEELERCRAICAVRNRAGENLSDASVGLEGKTRMHACRFQ